MVVASMCGLGTATAADQLAFFEKRIRPVLVEHCYECHSVEAKKIEGGLLLDSRAGIRQGGDSGPAVKQGNATGSLLLSALRYESLEMPPQAKLPDQVIADFQRWIAEGAVDPREGTVVKESPQIDLEQGRKFWSFQKPQSIDPPGVANADWAVNDIDRFILAPLEAQQLQPAADASRPELLRRIYYALVGLPPSPEAQEHFLADSSPLSEAMARVIDELLASPEFGQRWGRHWLDVVRYADSTGGGRSALLPHAWRYRDYVIDAFNRDLPYDQFVREQLAGDLLEAEDWQQRQQQITATAFLVLGPTNYELQDKEVLEMDIIDEQLDTLGKAFLGMTLGCARCHDHKFDPIPTRDYYAMAGILKSTRVVKHDNVSTYNTTVLPQSPAEELERKLFKARLEALEKEKKVLESTHKQWKQQLTENTAQFGESDLAKLAQQIADVTKKIKEAKSKQPPTPVSMAVTEHSKDNIGDIPLAIRGVTHNQGPVVPRGALQVCSNVEFAAIPAAQSGRLQLAEWITHPEHPLTARVMVNRVWHWLFGVGLVRTVDNFGATGSRPTHPELLDYLAVRFVEEGWSVKQLIRYIILSRTYRMSSEAGDLAAEIDPENRLLSRMNRRRLDAECIRDSLLSVAGKLDRQSGGPTIAPGTTSEYGYDFLSHRRSVYLPVFRNTLPELLEVFDFSDPNIPLGARAQSTTAPQASYLMNHPFVHEMSVAAAEQLVTGSDTNRSTMLNRVYRQVLGRTPSNGEAEIAAEFVGEDPTQVARWAMLYQTLFQSIDFRFVH